MHSPSTRSPPAPCRRLSSVHLQHQSLFLSFRFPVWVFLRYPVCEKGLTSPAVRELGRAGSSPGPSIFQPLPCFPRAVLQFLTPLLSSISNDWILKNTAAELFLAPFPPAPESAAHRQPLTAVRRGFQIPGFLLKCFNTSFLWAQPHWRGERNMPEELHKMPFVWGVWFFSLFCRKTKPLTEAVKAPPSWVPVQADESRWSHVTAPAAALGHSQGHKSVHPWYENFSILPSQSCSHPTEASGVLD